MSNFETDFEIVDKTKLDRVFLRELERGCFFHRLDKMPPHICQKINEVAAYDLNNISVENLNPDLEVTPIKKATLTIE